MTRRVFRHTAAAAILVAAVVLWQRNSIGQTRVPPHNRSAVAPAAMQTSAVVASNPLRNAYFGEMHVHTSWSLDAFSNGDVRDDPTVAYRYGRGDPIRNPDGTIRAQLRVPLDFMAVTDHDAFIGESTMCADASDPAYKTKICEELRSGAGTNAFMKVYNPMEMQGKRNQEICGTTEPGVNDRCHERVKNLWRQIEKNANAFYQPGKFTTFAAFEWTGTQKNGGWLHRNVFFLGPKIPEWGGSSVDMKQSPERLWEWLEQSCTGECQVIAIPHNTNYGRGVMLAPNNSDGTPFTTEILKRRAKAEPVIEIHQIKGNSECAKGLLSNDEDCNFEVLSSAKFPSDFVRNALKTGLAVEERYGINPFKYGIIGSTDDHKSAPGSTEERVWPGSFFGENGSMTQPAGPSDNPGGLAGVWAEANTREAIFDALKRRETFGTSGPRIRIRMFGGWKYAQDLHRSRKFVEDASKTGVPMGGDLPNRPADANAPRLVVWATKDPGSANLDRIQIVKGWLKGGETLEKVFDVVCSDSRPPDSRTNKCEDNGARVNLTDCSYSADKGVAELAITWTDPDFNPSERTFYYARVFENPTCRWSTWRAIDLKAKPPENVPPVIRERAWSSPIWFTPRN